MKNLILQAAILFTAIFFSDPLLAGRNDSLSKKELGILFFGGSRLEFKGIYFSGGVYYEKKRAVLTLKYSYFGNNYIKRDIYSGYLENTNSLSTMMGFAPSIKKFSIQFNLGLNIGAGRFVDKTRAYTAYFKTGFFGPTFNCLAKYDITKKLSAGVSFTESINYYFRYNQYYYTGSSSRQYSFTYINQFMGLQVCTAFRISYEKTYKVKASD